MYDINNKEEAIRELQRYLGGIENIENPPSPTGIYDERTEQSVKEVQEKGGLTVNGITDMATFDLIYREYLAEIDRRHAKRHAGVSVNFPIRVGDFGGKIYEINELLSRLADYYGEGHRIRRGGFFGEESARIVGVLKGVYGLFESREIDEVFYLRMYEDIDSIDRFY